MANVMENIVSIEMKPMVVDGSTPNNFIVIQTQRSNYCFRLTDKVNIQDQFEMFRTFVADVNTPIENVEQKKAELPKKNQTQWTMDSTQEEPKKEKHDGARLFDEPPTQPANIEITAQN